MQSGACGTCSRRSLHPGLPTQSLEHSGRSALHQGHPIFPKILSCPEERSLDKETSPAFTINPKTLHHPFPEGVCTRSIAGYCRESFTPRISSQGTFPKDRSLALYACPSTIKRWTGDDVSHKHSLYDPYSYIE